MLKEARERGWIEEAVGIEPTGKTLIYLTGPWIEMGPLVASAAHGDAATWTAIRSAQDEITVHTGTLAPPEDAAAAATIKEPRRGCPVPTRCNVRASQVLTSFCTASQIAQWNREGRMRVYGNSTGTAYDVYHRDEAARRGLSRSLVNAETRRVVCAWDRGVPAEEEALSLKLAIEHREDWLLQATA